MLSQRKVVLGNRPLAAVAAWRPRHAAPKAPSRRGVEARDNMKFQLAGESGDLSPAVAAGFFLAAKQGIFQATVANMRTVMTACVLAAVIGNVVVRHQYHHWDLNGLAPAALAAESFGFLSLGPAAIASFGTLLCTACEGVFKINGSYYFWLATLAASVYYGMGALWIAVAVVIAYGHQFVTQVQDNNIIVAPVVLAASAVWALVVYAKDKAISACTELCVAIVVARCLWALYKVGETIIKQESD